MSQAQKRVSGVFSRKPFGERPNGEGEGEAYPEAEEAGEVKGDVKEGKEGVGALREWIESSQQKLEEWQKKMDERFRHIVEGISPFASLQKEVAALGTRLAELEKKLDKLAGEKGDAGPSE